MHNLFSPQIENSLLDVIPRARTHSAETPVNERTITVKETSSDSHWQSRFAVSELASATIAAAAQEVAACIPTHRTRHSARHPAPGTTVTVDRRLASLWFRGSLLPTDFRPPAAWDAVAGDYRCSEGWIKLHTNAPHHRRAALETLSLPDTPELSRAQVAAAVRRCQAGVLEREIIERGGCAAQLRSLEAWRSHPQGRALAREGLIDWQTSNVLTQDHSGLLPHATGDQPLRGLRVLDLTRVLAGPVATRFLARFGADVLRIDPPWWEEPGVVPEVTLGKRCAGLDLTQKADRVRFEHLLSEADLLMHGYRPGALDRLGYDSQTLLVINPAVVDVALCAYGWTGPWANRRGFDSLVQMSSGIAHPGMEPSPGRSPQPLPVQALDHATGYLMAAAALRALRVRYTQGAVMRARLSLARTAQLLIDAFFNEPVSGTAQATGLNTTIQHEGALNDLDEFDEVTSWGRARRLAFPVVVEGVTPSWTQPAGELRRDTPGWTSR